MNEIVVRTTGTLRFYVWETGKKINRNKDISLTLNCLSVSNFETYTPHSMLLSSKENTRNHHRNKQVNKWPVFSVHSGKRKDDRHNLVKRHALWPFSGHSQRRVFADGSLQIQMLPNMYLPESSLKAPSAVSLSDPWNYPLQPSTLLFHSAHSTNRNSGLAYLAHGCSCVLVWWVTSCAEVLQPSAQAHLPSFRPPRLWRAFWRKAVCAQELHFRDEFWCCILTMELFSLLRQCDLVTVHVKFSICMPSIQTFSSPLQAAWC